MGNSKLSLMRSIKGENIKTRKEAPGSDFGSKQTGSRKQKQQELEEDMIWYRTDFDNNIIDPNGIFRVSRSNPLFRSRSCSAVSFEPEKFSDTVFDDIFAHIERQAAKPTSPTRKSVPIGLDSSNLY